MRGRRSSRASAGNQQQQEHQRQEQQQQLPFTGSEAVDDDFLEESSNSPKIRPSNQLERSQSSNAGYLSSSYNQRIPSRSFFHHASHGSLEPVHYASSGVRERTQELASWALGESGSMRSNNAASGRSHAASESASGSRSYIPPLLYDSGRTDINDPLETTIPQVIDEASEPIITEEHEDAHGSDLADMILPLPAKRLPRPSRREDHNEHASHDGVPSVIVEGTVPGDTTEDTALLPKGKLAASHQKRRYGGTSDGGSLRGGKLNLWMRVKGRSIGLARTMRNPKTWNVKNIWRVAIVTPALMLPAVFLGWLLNVLDGLSYGIILFPLGEDVFADTAADGISIFFVSCIVSQLVFSLGGSVFKGGVGSEMIEVVPFFHKMAYMIMNRMDGASAQAIVATVILSYSLSSILTGFIFVLLGAFKLGNLVSFFPRSILNGCIGGVGLFLFITGIEVSARLDGNLEYDLPTFHKLLKLDTLVLWILPLVLAVILVAIRARFTHPLVMPVYFITLTVVFYFFVAVIPQLHLDGLRSAGWIFEKPPLGVPFYRFYSYYNFKLVDWEALSSTVPTMFALSFFGIIHVPINVPALGLAAQEDDVNVNRELIAHGLSNGLSGCMGSIQNYLVYANSAMFIQNGGNSRLAGVLLAIATFATWIAGPGLIGFIPVLIVGTLIYYLGIDLMTEALWTTFGRIHRLEYLMVVAIVLVMGLYDFVVGIVVGIVLACLIYVIQTSRVSAVQGTYTGVVAESTVRRHPIQRRFLHEVGNQIYVTKLAGYLFFGTIVAVENKIKSLIDEEALKKRPIRFLILDFSHVFGMDFSAAEAFTRMHRALRRRKIEMILSGVSVSGEVGRSLTMVGLLDEEKGCEADPPPKVFEDLNKALESCENELLLALKQRSEMLAQKKGAKAVSMAVPKADSPMVPSEALYNSPRGQLIQKAITTTLNEHDVLAPARYYNFAQPLPLILQSFQELTDKDLDFWHRAVPYFEKREFPAGTVLYSRGDEPDGFYLLEQGILRAEHDTEQGSYYESIVAGTTCGELPFFSDTNRTGTVVAEKDCVAWLLTKEKWKELEGELPDVARELLKIGMKLTSERMKAITSYVLVTAS